jgi:hypothetical protein
MADVESWLSVTQDQVATAQRVLSEVERGLAAVEKAEDLAQRVRPVLRIAGVVIVGGLVGVGIALIVSRRRRDDQIEFVTDQSSEEGPTS